jgi:membrane-bound lytic murein transglycosylase D
MKKQKKIIYFNFIFKLGLFIFCIFSPRLYARIVPEEMWYCGIKLRFTPEAREEIQKKVDYIFDNIASYKVLVERADLYMPFINDAFEQIGAPEDLKYIVIQESGLRADAVSSSQAVGFWQMKDFTAREVGLDINNWIDERKHIFRASIGAARYFHKQYRRFDNWLYAVIAYYAGGTGALPYVKSEYYGAREMIITEDLHWYAQKAIAHKIAFESAIQRNKNLSLWLIPYDTDGEISAKRLAERHMIDWQEFKKYNLWINESSLPSGKPMSYYIPQRNKPFVHIKDPHIHLFEPAPALVARGQLASIRVPAQDQTATKNSQLPITENDANAFSQWFTKRNKFNTFTPPPSAKVLEYPIEKEPLFGKELDEITDKTTLIDLASKHEISIRKLRKWNKLAPGEEPEPGSLILLVKPSKARIHIARKMETIADVAVRYNKKIEKLMEYNNIDSMSHLLMEGEKVHLRDKRPQDKYIIVYFSRFKRKNNKISGDEQNKNSSQAQAIYSELGALQTKSDSLEKQTISANNPGFEAPPQKDQKLASGANPLAENETDPKWEEDAAWNTFTSAETEERPQKPAASYYANSAGKNKTSTNGKTSSKKTGLVQSTASNPVKSAFVSQISTTGSGKIAQPFTPKANSPKQSGAEPPSSSPSNFQWYEVKKGDTIWNISQRFNMKADELKTINNLADMDIKIGQKIKVKK